MRKAIHPVHEPWLCLTPTSDRLALEDCSTTHPEQRWHHHEDTLTLENVSSRRCIDVDSAGGRLLLYGCHGHWNQQWQQVHHSDAVWLTALPAETLRKLLRVFEP